MEIFKVLGQVAPAISTLTTLYTVPAGLNARIQGIVVCNRAVAASTFRIAIAPGGAADDVKHYLYYDKGINGIDSFQDLMEIPLSAGDEVRVYATTANLTFNIFGREIN